MRKGEMTLLGKDEALKAFFDDKLEWLLSEDENAECNDEINYLLLDFEKISSEITFSIELNNFDKRVLCVIYSLYEFGISKISFTRIAKHIFMTDALNTDHIEKIEQSVNKLHLADASGNYDILSFYVGKTKYTPVSGHIVESEIITTKIKGKIKGGIEIIAKSLLLDFAKASNLISVFPISWIRTQLPLTEENISAQNEFILKCLNNERN